MSSVCCSMYPTNFLDCQMEWFLRLGFIFHRCYKFQQIHHEIHVCVAQKQLMSWCNAWPLQKRTLPTPCTFEVPFSMWRKVGVSRKKKKKHDDDEWKGRLSSKPNRLLRLNFGLKLCTLRSKINKKWSKIQKSPYWTQGIYIRVQVQLTSFSFTPL